MKKALALVLALVLALSMAVSAFALTPVTLVPVETEEDEIIDIPVVNVEDVTLRTYEGGEFYIALPDAEWENIEVTANGNVTAELVEYDPATMNIEGINVDFMVVNNKTEADIALYMELNDVEAYELALKKAAECNKAEKVTYYGVELRTNVNIIKLVIEDNYSAHYTKGTVKVEATKEEAGEDVEYAGTVTIINDVVNFEYEMVKWTADNFNAKLAKSEFLRVDSEGYSDYDADIYGYDVEDAEYDEKENRVDEFAAVISTTAFRAIEGKDIRVNIINSAVEEGEQLTVGVALYDIVKGQKGVNFKGYAELDFVDKYPYNEVRDNNEVVKAIEFGFYGDQVVKGAYEITLTTTYDWFELRELFDVEVEEDDIISYYLVDANGKVVGGKEVDYMTADLDEIATFTIKGENNKLGQYKLVLEVPAEEVGEANPNTGAESVVGVVAALAVVSVATAAAVSLKK